MKVGRINYDRDMYSKMYDIIELIYILNRLSEKPYVDDSSKQYLIGMLNNMESVKSNFDRYRYKDYDPGNTQIHSSGYSGYNYKGQSSFGDKIILFLKSLNNEQ